MGEERRPLYLAGTDSTGPLGTGRDADPGNSTTGHGLADLGLLDLALASEWAAATRLSLGLYFFRDPPRRIPPEDGLLVAPADGKIAEVTRLDHDPFLGGPAVRIGVFLSIFNVHINRAPCAAQVIELRYAPGLFLNAINPQSAIKNENMWIGLQEENPPYRRFVVRQIAGLIARRIVCAARPGETLSRGGQFGMIKLGSRTELIVPDETGLSVTVKVGDRIKAGTTILAQYPSDLH